MSDLIKLLTVIFALFWNKSKSDKWKKFDSNQRNFFSLWAKTEKIGKSHFIYDKEFYDDILFNHLENINLDKRRNI